MDQITKIMHQVTGFEKKRLARLAVFSFLAVILLFCVLLYCCLSVVSSVEEFGLWDLSGVFWENPQELWNILTENFSIFFEYFEIEIILSLALSFIFIALILLKTDFPSFPKRFKETKKY